MIKINVDKAKTIAHDMRRDQRSKEFAPHDEVIAKQIPGMDAELAETERAKIRDKYAAIQTKIDSAQNVSELFEVVNEIKAQ